jgi:hypothetical protein
MELKEYYSSHIKNISIELEEKKHKSRSFITAEIISFLTAIGAVVGYFSISSSSLWWLLALVSLVVYVLVRNADAKNDVSIRLKEALMRVYQKELRALDSHFEDFRDGSEYQNLHHEFSFDLDIFGPDSLFNRMNRTVTSGGSDRLAHLLSTIEWNRNSRAAIHELSRHEEFLASFKSNGEFQYIDTHVVTQAIDAIEKIKVPTLFHSPVVKFLCCLDIIFLSICIIASFLGWVSSSLSVWWGVTNFFMMMAICRHSISQMSRVVANLHQQLSSLIQLVRLIDGSKFASSHLCVIHEQLSMATDSFIALKRILNSLESRSNILGLIIFNILGLSDYFLVRRFAYWQQNFANRMPLWVEAISDMDALVSMATFEYNHPEAKEAEVVETPRLIFEAENLYHPFLGATAKKNDFRIKDRNYYIITGANMAGKSTFFRAIGVNYILAMNGIPVFADSLRVSCFKLFSSMRTQDDLSHGISYFNAELLRLQQLIDYVSGDERPTLLILDEILKGTNSADKLNGSRLFLESMSSKNVSGVIATHDLELSQLAEQRPMQFHNYCFEIQVGQHVTYDYKITSGVARNQNATYLLKQILDKCQ